MAFPTRGWPPPSASASKSLRVYLTGTGTANFEDNAFLFRDVPGANPYTPLPVVQPGSSAPVDVSTPPAGAGDNGSEGTDGPYPAIWANTIAIAAVGAAVEFSFDGTTVHGVVPAGARYEYAGRYEAGISVRGVGATYTVEAW